jgi:hypothetical protein
MVPGGTVTSMSTRRRSRFGIIRKAEAAKYLFPNKRFDLLVHEEPEKPSFPI